MPLSRHEDTDWIKVQVQGSNEEGWVNASSRYVSCSGPLSSLPVDGTPPASTDLPEQVKFDADDTTVVEGECTTLRWDVENVKSVSLDGEDVDGHGSKTICPMKTHFYGLTVVTASETASYVVIVSVGAVDVQFAADNYTIQSGECTTLRWDVKNVQAVSLDGERVVERGSTTACPKETQTYTLRVVTATGTQDYEATVSVRPPAVVTVQLTEDDIKNLVRRMTSQADHDRANIRVTLEGAGDNEVLVETKFTAKKRDAKVTANLRLYIQGDRLKTQVTWFRVEAGSWPCSLDFKRKNPTGPVHETVCGFEAINENFDDFMSKLDKTLEGMLPGSVQSLQVQGNEVLVTYIPT